MANGVWTNNWTAVKNTMLLGGIYPGLNTLQFSDGTTLARRSDNSTYTASPTAPTDLLTIRLGVGTNTPSAGDYSITSPSNFNYLSVSANDPVYDLSTATITRSTIVTVQYAGNGSITLTEWGLFLPVYAGGNYGSTLGSFLAYRELFDSPIVIQQYQAAALELTISLTLTNPQ